MEKEKVETKQGISGGVLCLIVVLCILLGLTSGYIIHDKLMDKTVNEKNEIKNIIEEKENNNKEEKETENKTNYKELDLSNECFNKNESCKKEYELNYNGSNNTIVINNNSEKNEFYLSINGKEVINAHKLSKIYLLENGTFIFDEYNTYIYYSKELNIITEIEKEAIKNNNFTNFKYNNYEYTLTDNDTIEVKLLNIKEADNNGKSNNIVLNDKECINSKQSCEKVYTISNGNQDVNIKAIIKGGKKCENNDPCYQKEIYLNDKIIDSYEINNNTGIDNIKQIAILDNSLIVIEKHSGDSIANNLYRIYYNIDGTKLLEINDHSFLSGKLEGKITEKEITIYEGEEGCTTQLSERVLHIKKYRIISNVKYQIIGLGTSKTGCAGQS